MCIRGRAVILFPRLKGIEVGGDAGRIDPAEGYETEVPYCTSWEHTRSIRKETRIDSSVVLTLAYPDCLYNADSGALSV